MYPPTPLRALRNATIEELIAPSGLTTADLSMLAGGVLLERFEQQLAQLADSTYALALSSGSAALHIALMAADVGPGDEVIVSAYGWGQTVSAVLTCGATPVFADVEFASGNISVASVEEHVTDKTRAVLATHLFGLPANMLLLSKACARKGLTLINDGAQALGARYHNKGIGAWGDITCLSFGHGKALTAGEGGAIVTDSVEILERALLCSQHPLRCMREVQNPKLRDSVSEFGMSYRMPSLSLALALRRIKHVPTVISSARQAAKELTRACHDLDIVTPSEPHGSLHAFHTYVATTEQPRNLILDQLESMNLACQLGPVRTPLNLRWPFLKSGGKWFPRALTPVQRNWTWRKGSCPVAERRCRQELHIPLQMNTVNEECT